MAWWRFDSGLSLGLLVFGRRTVGVHEQVAVPTEKRAEEWLGRQYNYPTDQHISVFPVDAFYVHHLVERVSVELDSLIVKGSATDLICCLLGHLRLGAAGPPADPGGLQGARRWRQLLSQPPPPERSNRRAAWRHLSTQPRATGSTFSHRTRPAAATSASGASNQSEMPGGGVRLWLFGVGLAFRPVSDCVLVISLASPAIPGREELAFP